ncbi:MAG: flagellar export protein FliJ [Hydrogenovibrio sp.]|nr:flagellar export protein FliJ [Hydrogenovibrio sp.]
MATSRLERMQKLVDLAQAEVESASKLLRNLQQQHNQEQAQLDSLQSYQVEYIHKLTRKESTTLQQLNTTQAFLDKLNLAISEQTNEITKLDQAIDEAKEQWIEHRKREQSLVKLYQKLKKNHQVRLDKLEQRVLDDLAGRQFYLDRNSED